MKGKEGCEEKQKAQSKADGQKKGGVSLGGKSAIKKREFLL